MDTELGKVNRTLGGEQRESHLVFFSFHGFTASCEPTRTLHRFLNTRGGASASASASATSMPAVEGAFLTELMLL